MMKAVTIVCAKANLNLFLFGWLWDATQTFVDSKRSCIDIATDFMLQFE